MFKHTLLPFICLFWFLPVGPGVSGNWTQLVSPTTNALNSVFFADSLNGWAAGDSGIIVHTTDGGENWFVQNSGTVREIVDVFFLNRHTGWVVSWDLSRTFGTELLSTNDGGAHWSGVGEILSNQFVKSVFFLDSLNGYIGGLPDVFAETRNGGLEWTQVQIDSGTFAHFPVFNFSLYSAKYGFACGGHFDLAGVIWRTLNSGRSWSVQGVGPEPVHQLQIIDSLCIVGVGGDPEFGSSFVRTKNGGESWEYQTLGIFGIASALAFRTPAEGWATLGVGRKFIVTTDTGSTWTEVPTPGNTSIFDLTFTDTHHGYAVGDSGTILKYNFLSDLEKSAQAVYSAQQFQLEQNFPNPFNPQTTIRFHLRKPGIVTLVVYDLLGRKIAVLVDGKRSAGNYRVDFSAEDLSSGIYFCSLWFNPENSGRGFTQTRRMVLIR